MRKNIISLLFITFLSGSCASQLDEINENPNATENPDPAYLLTGSLKHGANVYWGLESNFNSSLLFVQHWAKRQQPDPDRYYFSNAAPEMTTLWSTGYATLITDLNTILNDEKANQNYKSVALTLRSWTFLLLTDLYGDIPYTEAGKNVVPVYDTQKDVYIGLLGDLSEALSLLGTDNGKITGDVVYKGDINKWKKLANSLKLRIALRIADKEEALAKQTISSLNPADLINNNEEAFVFTYNTSPNQNPQAATFETRDDYRISKTIVDKLKNLNDPRLQVYAQKTAAGGDYIGGANGLSEGDAIAQEANKTSIPGTYFLKPTAPAVIYSYAEVLFNLAEAVARGYIAGEAKAYYEQAITASFKQFEITDESVISSYLAQTDVRYKVANYKQSIGEQKWIAFYGQGLDAFTEWRRLDYPVLTAVPASVLGRKLPLRFLYPDIEQTRNAKNYQAATSRQGKNELTIRLWFDAN